MLRKLSTKENELLQEAKKWIAWEWNPQLELKVKTMSISNINKNRFQFQEQHYRVLTFRKTIDQVHLNDDSSIYFWKGSIFHKLIRIF